MQKGKEKIMAIPIRSVPTLYGEDAARFLSQVEASERAAQERAKRGETIRRAISRERLHSYLHEMNML